MAEPARAGPFRQWLLLTGLLLGCLRPGVAQSLPLLHPGNPLAESRSGLYFQPLVAPGPGWRLAVGMDYVSALELDFRFTLADTAYLLDAELLRLNFSVARHLGRHTFVTAEAWLGGSYPGFLDGFLNRYHGLLGIPFPQREKRPHGRFDYRYTFRDGRTVEFDRTGLGLGDVRLGVGRRLGDQAQSVLSLTIPTSTMGDGFARGVVSASLLNTFQVPITPRLRYEGSVNFGYAPRHGPLASLQERLFFLGTSGVQWRTFGRLWSFGNLYLHSPYYSGTDLGPLDKWDFTIDFGWIIRGKSGREFRFGMTEDLWPSGPAVDASFRVGYAW